MGDFKEKFNHLWGQAKNEMEKTTKIGVKLFQSGQLCSELHEKLQDLGRYYFDCVQQNKDLAPNESAQKLIDEIQQLKIEIHKSEEEITSIKKQVNN